MSSMRLGGLLFAVSFVGCSTPALSRDGAATDGEDLVASPSGDMTLAPNGEAGPGSCTDGVQDGDETDVDCGGPICTPCAESRMCLQARDCMRADCVNGWCGAPPDMTPAPDIGALPDCTVVPFLTFRVGTTVDFGNVGQSGGGDLGTDVQNTSGQNLAIMSETLLSSDSPSPFSYYFSGFIGFNAPTTVPAGAKTMMDVKFQNPGATGTHDYNAVVVFSTSLGNANLCLHARTMQ